MPQLQEVTWLFHASCHHQAFCPAVCAAFPYFPPSQGNRGINNNDERAEGGKSTLKDRDFQALQQEKQPLLCCPSSGQQQAGRRAGGNPSHAGKGQRLPCLDSRWGFLWLKVLLLSFQEGFLFGRLQLCGGCTQRGGCSRRGGKIFNQAIMNELWLPALRAASYGRLKI